MNCTHTHLHINTEKDNIRRRPWRMKENSLDFAIILWYVHHRTPLYTRFKLCKIKYSHTSVEICKPQTIRCVARCDR